MTLLLKKLRILNPPQANITHTFTWDGKDAYTAALTGRSYTPTLPLPNGDIYIVNQNRQIARITNAMPGFNALDYAIPSEDGSTLWWFDRNGKHLQTTNALTGAVIHSFGYDTNSMLVSITDGDANVTTIQRDGAGNATGIVSPYGVRTALTLNANGYLASVTDPGGNATRFTYSPDGLIATMTDPNNGVYTFTHDAMGKLVKDQNPAGGSWTLAKAGTVTNYTVTMTSAEGRAKSYSVAAQPNGSVVSTNTSPSGATSVSVTKLDGTTVSTSADGTVTTVAKSPDPRFGMNAPTRNVTMKTPSGLTATLASARTVTLANASDLLSLTALTETLTVNGLATRASFNKAAMTITTTTPMSKQVTRNLDSKGRVTQTNISGLLPVNYSYDIRGRMNTVTQGTRLSSFAYDAMGNIVGVTDPLGQTTGFGYDTSGQVTSQTLSDGRVINFTYDANGNVTSVTPPSRPAHGFSYTSVNLESSYNPPAVTGSGTTNTTYAYNLDKQLTRITRPDGQLTDYGYDTAGRLSTITLPGASLAYIYGAGGACCGNPSLPQAITRNSGGATQTLNYTYDASLLTSTSWSGIINGSVSRTYDNFYRITSRSVNGANNISQTYDNDGLLASVGSLTIARNTGNGFITGTTLGTSTTGYTYNTFGEVDTYAAKYGATTLFNTAYTRDVLSRITRKVETVSGATTTFDYQYDQAGRLVGVSKNGVTVSSYVYDNNANRITSTQNGTATQGFYDAQDRMVTYGNNSYTHTANGELLTKTANGQTTTYNYDVVGNLISVALPDGTLIEYLIDGLNRRIGKKVNGVLTQAWLYQDGLKPIAELDGAGNVVARFIYGPTGHSPDYMLKGGATYRIVSDHLGSPRLVVNSVTGAIVQQLNYDEWGNITADSAPGFAPFGFAGGLYDQHTRLTCYGARDYDPETGRMLAADPMLFRGGGLNMYTYAGSDPINYRDVAGLKVDWNDMVLSNPDVRSNLEKLNNSIINQGKRDDEFTIKVTGGDRYKDSDGKTRSSSNDEIVPGSSKKTQHRTDNGSTAVDINTKNVTADELDKALEKTDFDPSREINKYKDGHRHIEVPKRKEPVIPTILYWPSIGTPIECP